ncbi:MAG: FitA-like ribbon-helix-helix domain-containing protein [Anaerolineae bacterium]
MAILHVRGVPDELVEQVKERARAEKRSLSAEVVVLLSQCAGDLARDEADVLAEVRLLGRVPGQGPSGPTAPPGVATAELLTRIERRRQSIPSARTPDSVELIREDRER